DKYILSRDDYRIRKDIPALPFSRERKAVLRPKRPGYPKELRTIGDHIRAWRIDNHLSQASVAKILSVCEDSVVGWEMKGTTPTMRYMPHITRMLGYLPVQIDTSTLAGRIIQFRYLNGISQEDLADALGINESTVFHYEKGTHKPSPKILIS